ncbi:UNVERIFIED_CONTAM: hypothetical protein HDU68_010676 [Siphonaria sp. JEL0065]|nr:hypothetical protein HDU68_010676 [Siphonaria sp. JEL0065]
MGDYYTAISSTLLTGEQGSSSSASPDLKALYRKRFVIGSEPQKGKTINSGFMKGITGNDDIVARPLYGNVITFKPSHTLVLLCNGIPRMDEQDAAVIARSVVIPFPVTFSDNPSGHNERQIDKTLKKKIKKWGPQMMLLMVGWYREYTEKGLRKTDALVATTNEYAEEANPALRWFNTCTEPHPTERFHLNELFPVFRAWHLENERSNNVGDVRSFGKGLRDGGVRCHELGCQRSGVALIYT